jgi:hypothetical protein
MAFEQIGGIPGGIPFNNRPGIEDPDNIDPEEVARIMGPREVEIREDELDPDFAPESFRTGFDQEESYDAAGRAPQEEDFV